MSVQINYKNSTIGTVANGATKTINTAGTWVEDDIEIVDTTNLKIYYTGTSAPSSALGSNGDLYFQTSEV